MDIRRVGVPGAAALCAALLSGCGSGGNALDAATAANLHSQVAAIRAAAAAGNDSAAAKRLAELRSTIQQLTSGHQLNATDGMTMLTQVDRLAGRIAVAPTPTPTPAPTVAVRTTVTAPTHSAGDAKPKPKGPGKGKGHRK
jgi:hypothetical protein